MSNNEVKFKTSVRYMIEEPDGTLNVEGLALVLEEILSKLDAPPPTNNSQNA